MTGQVEIGEVNLLDVDLDAFELMLASPAFRYFMQRVTQELNRVKSDCLSADDQRDIYRAQGAVTALEAVDDLPEIIHDKLNRRGKR